MTSSSRFARRLILSILPATLLAGHPLHPAPARASDLPDWEDPQVLGINKLDPHAPVYPFADEATARGLDRSKSPYYRLLNGRWKFRFSPHPDARPKTVDDFRAYLFGTREVPTGPLGSARQTSPALDFQILSSDSILALAALGLFLLSLATTLVR